jgi:PBP1b-binding outer membrane lipoprotein LpoB
MRRIIGLLFFITLILGCATTSTSSIQQGKEPDLAQVTSVAVTQFQCSNEAISKAVQNTIIEMLLPSNIRIVTDKASADAVIQGSITFSHDAVSSGGAYVGQTAGGAYASSTAGSYVSGITSQITKGDEIIAAASVTQVRTEFWIPDPPEVMARKIGEKIKTILGH